MEAVFAHAGSVQGEAAVPADKSISHRAAILGAMAEGRTVAGNFLRSGDCLSTLSCLRALGVQIELEGDTLHLISFRTGISYQKLAKWNRIPSPYRIYVGEKLSLRAGAPPARPAPKPKTATASTPRPSASPPPSAKLASKPLPEVKLPSKVSAWKWPAKGKLAQTFSPNKAQYGIDIKGSRSSPVLAAASGQVVYAGDGIRGYGELVIVKHSDQYVSAYAYNDSILVKEGDTVAAGQQIARMGSTGTRGVKLHFEIRKDGEPVNPLQYLPLQSS